MSPFNLKAGSPPPPEGTMLVLEESLELIELRRRPLDDDGNEFEDGEFEFDDDEDDEDPFDDDEDEDDDDDDDEDDLDDIDEDDSLGGDDDE
jgi:hypothetical protein